MRAIYELDKNDKSQVIITALPSQVSGNKIIEQIAKLMTDKKLPWVTDINDESDHETRAVSSVCVQHGWTLSE